MDVLVKTAEESDLKQLGEWLQLNLARNGLDPQVLGYPSLAVLKACHNGTTLAYLPVHHVVMMESLAPNPSPPNGSLALAVRQLVTVVAYNAYQKGAREIYFIGSDEETNKFAEKHGFEKLEMPIYRLKLT